MRDSFGFCVGYHTKEETNEFPALDVLLAVIEHFYSIVSKGLCIQRDVIVNI